MCAPFVIDEQPARHCLVLLARAAHRNTLALLAAGVDSSEIMYNTVQKVSCHTPFSFHLCIQSGFIFLSHAAPPSAQVTLLPPKKCTRTPTLEQLADIAHMFCTAPFRCRCFYVSQPPKILGNYVIGNRLGEGAFGRVKEAVHIRNLERVAIKIMKVKRSTLTQLNSTHVRAHTRYHARMHVWWWR